MVKVLIFHFFNSHLLSPIGGWGGSTKEYLKNKLNLTCYFYFIKCDQMIFPPSPLVCLGYFLCLVFNFRKCNKDIFFPLMYLQLKIF